MLNKKKTIRKMPVLGFRAEIAKESVDAENRTVKLIFSTGAKVRRIDWDKLEVFEEELSLDKKHVRLERMNSGAPLLDSHQNWRLADMLGVVESAEVDGKIGTCVVRFPKAEDDENADKIFRKVKDGIIRNVSVGYRVHTYEEVGDSKSARKNGELPVYRAVDWEPMEVSLVPIPADHKSQVRSGGENKDERFFDCVFVRGETMKKKLKSVRDEELKRKLRAEEAKEEEREDEIDEDEEEREESEEQEEREESEEEREESEEDEKPNETKGERKVKQKLEKRVASVSTRSVEILKSCEAAGLDTAFARGLIESGKSVEQARGDIINEMAKRSAPAQSISPAKSGGSPRIEAGVDADDKFREGASNWLMIRSGRGVQDAVEKSTGQKLDGGQFRGFSLLDIARESLERRGVSTRGWDRMKIVGEALTQRSGGMATTSDFAILLESAMHKTLLGAYAVTPDTWSRFCRKGTVSDFREHNRYRVGSFGTLDVVGEHGEFQNKAIPDGEKASISAKTKGNIIALSRQAIVNDDMQAFADLAMRFGRAARLSVEKDVYDLLGQNSGLGPTQSDSQPFFHANRKNVGTGTALDVAGIDADRVLMAAQTDPSGNEILDLRPKVLLVAAGLEGQARSVNEAIYDPDAVGKIAKPNYVLGLFEDVIGTARLTGKRRYLFADPSIAPAFEVAFLDGVEEPFLEAKEGWRIDGVEWKVRLDYGVKEIDPRGAVTNAGQ